MAWLYLETKVVKVKKEKKENYCPCCGGKIEMEKPKGNWVNGENLDKIKFPCFCSYIKNSKKYFGLIYKTIPIHVLCCLNQDTTGLERRSGDDCIIDSYVSLKNLIKDYDIHILKGKIILFEEEE